jgi:hypothetical protein
MRIQEVTAGQVAQGAEKVSDVASNASNAGTAIDYAAKGTQKAANVIGKGAQLANAVNSVADAAPALTKVGGKLMKFLPGAGLVAAGADTIRRGAAGDYTGAALSAASGAAGLIPGVGTAASLALTGAQAARDYHNYGTMSPSTDQLAAASGKGTKDGFPQVASNSQANNQATKPADPKATVKQPVAEELFSILKNAGIK